MLDWESDQMISLEIVKNYFLYFPKYLLHMRGVQINLCILMTFIFDSIN